MTHPTSDDRLSSSTAFKPTEVFSVMLCHDCPRFGCQSDECALCATAPHRRCTSILPATVMAGDPVRAPCGAPLTVDLFAPDGDARLRKAPEFAHARVAVVQADVLNLGLHGCLMVGADEGEPRPAQRPRLAPADPGVDALVESAVAAVARCQVVPDRITVEAAVRNAVRVRDMRHQRVDAGYGRLGPAPVDAATVVAAIELARLEVAPAPPPPPAQDGVAGIITPPQGAPLGPAGSRRRPLPQRENILSRDVIPFDTDAPHATASLADDLFEVPSDRTVLAHPHVNLEAARIVLDIVHPAAAAGLPTLPPGSVYLVAACCMPDGAAVLDVMPAISKPFVIAARRPRLAKADRPLTTDSVSALHGVGVNTVAKLGCLRQCSEDAGITLDLPSDMLRIGVHTVADMQGLLAFITVSAGLDEDVRRTLALTRSQWAEIKESVEWAVTPDDSLRLFYTDDHKHGLIYANHMGAPNPRRPLALLSPAYADAPRPGVRPVPVDGGAAYIVGHSITLVDTVDPNLLEQVIAEATYKWLRVRHRGWQVLEAGGRKYCRLDALLQYVMRVGNPLHLDGMPLLEVQHVTVGQ